MSYTCEQIAAELGKGYAGESSGAPQVDVLDVLARLLDPLEILAFVVEFFVEGAAG